MATKNIRIRALTTQLATQQLVVLDNVPVGLRFRHCKRDGFWYMWILNTAMVQLAGPVKLVSGIDDLFEQFRYLDLPPGRLYMSETPDKDTVDVSAMLYYEGV